MAMPAPRFDDPWRRLACLPSRLLAPVLSPVLSRVLPLVLPSHCALCGMDCPGVVCPPCRAHYAAPRRDRCARCANPLSARGVSETGVSTTDTCGACLDYPPWYDATVAAVDYVAPLDALVLRLKFNACLALAPWCAEVIADAVLARPRLPLPDVLCPVPLGPARLVERGFNQALEIARPLSRAMGVELAPALAARTTETQAQSGMAPGARAENIRGAFGVTDPDGIAGRHVGIVDDVMSSGHTLNELAATFKRFGAARVTNLVFARTPPRSTAI
jgi:ComF family protein